MFCPNCKSEYRAGFTRCSDCDVDLVEALFAEEEIQWTSVWNGDSQANCVEFCTALREADIPYLVTQTPMGLSRGLGVDFSYEIRVTTANHARAMSLLGTGSELPDESFEIPALEAPPTEPSSNRRLRKKSLTSSFEVEVFSQPPEDRNPTVELSLRTNLIPFQTELDENGTRRFFVEPEDESRAREIIRQIQEGTPPD
jgi:hypothetical protein